MNQLCFALSHMTCCERCECWPLRADTVIYDAIKLDKQWENKSAAAPLIICPRPDCWGFQSCEHVFVLLSLLDSPLFFIAVEWDSEHKHTDRRWSQIKANVSLHESDQLQFSHQHLRKGKTCLKNWCNANFKTPCNNPVDGPLLDPSHTLEKRWL